MSETKNKRVLVAWAIVLCMVIPMVMPVFAYAQTNDALICVDGQEYTMSVSPEKSELGLMVSAKDLANAFSLEYVFDYENKAFEIYDDTHGKIVLMHNATTFYSGEEIYECSPCFYVRNGEPLVEVGFFCNMFVSSYEYDESMNKIIVYKNKISDDIAKIEYNGTIVPMYMEPVATESGMFAMLADLVAGFGNISYEYDETNETAVLTDESGNYIELVAGATTFKSSYGEFECAPLFNIGNNAPMIEVGFFCDLYGIAYQYDEQTKTMTIYDDVTMEELYEMSNVQLMSLDSIVSGRISYGAGAPNEGLNVKLVLQQIGSRYQMYSGTTYYTGNCYTVGTVNFAKGETSKTYSIDVSDYSSSGYPYFALYYAETNKDKYGFYNTARGVTQIDYSPLSNNRYNSLAYKFGYSSYSNIDMSIGNNCITGKIALGENILAPAGGINVNLILQTRTRIYNYMYGGSNYYNIGSNNNLGTVTIPQGSNSSDYSFDISKYSPDYYDSMYSLFYSSEGNECVKPYGYYNTNNSVTSIPSIPGYGACYYTNAKTFSMSVSGYADLILPIRDDYVADEGAVASPTSNIRSGYVDNGTRIILSSSTSGVDIYYTTDGSVPTAYSNKYTGSILIEKDTIIKAIAVKSGMSNSNVATYTYIVNNNDFIKLVVGETNALINGKTVAMDVAPVVIDKNVYVPVRFIGEAIGATVEWNGTLQQVIFVKDGKSLTLTVDDGDCYIINARTLVNANTVFAELLGDDYVIESTPISVTVNEKEIDEPSIKVISAKSTPGKTVDVVIEVESNPGIAILGFNVNYDNTAMTLKSATLGEIFTAELECNIASVPFVFNVYSGSENKTNNGKLVTLQFEIKSDCAEGDYAISLSDIEALNISENDVFFETENGTITVTNSIPGDVTGDGKVTRADLLRLAKSFSGFEVEMDMEAADVTGDGKVTRTDLLRLAKHFSGFDVVLGK